MCLLCNNASSASNNFFDEFGARNLVHTVEVVPVSWK